MGLGVSCVFRYDLVVTIDKAVRSFAVLAVVLAVLPPELRHRIPSPSTPVAATPFPARLPLAVTLRPMGSLLSKAEPGEPVRQLIGIVVVVEMENKPPCISVSAVIATSCPL